MTELQIQTVTDIGNNILGFNYTMITATNIQHIFDFKLLFCTFRIDFCPDCTMFTVGIYKLYARFGIGIE